MKPLEEQLAEAGLQVAGRCQRLTSYGEDMLQISALLQDMTPAEADILGESMLLVRAEPGQVLLREGDVGEWMLMLLKGTVDITKRVEVRGEAAKREAANASGDAGSVAADGKAEAKDASSADSGHSGSTSESSQGGEDAGVDTTPFSRIAVIQRGAAIGEMSMLDSEPRYSSCTAIDAVEAGVLGHREIGLLIRDHPAVGAKLLVKITQLMAQRLRNTSNQLVKLMLKKG